MSSQRIGIFILLCFWGVALLFFKFYHPRIVEPDLHSAVMGPFKISQKMLLGAPLSINEMSEKDWELLPHIGPTLAKKIVAFKEERGDFRTVEDLLKVHGVGPKTLQKIKTYLLPPVSKN